MLLRNPCKNLKSYVMPLWGFSNGSNNNKNKNNKKRKIPKIVASYVCTADARTLLGPKFAENGTGASK